MQQDAEGEGFLVWANNGKNILNIHQRSALREGGAGRAFASQLLLTEDLRIKARFAVVKLHRTGHVFRLGCSRRIMCECAEGGAHSMWAEELKNDVAVTEAVLC